VDPLFNFVFLLKENKPGRKPNKNNTF